MPFIRMEMIPEDDRTQRLHELEPEDFEFPEHRRNDLIIIEITMFKGRSLEAQRLLHRRIAERLRGNPGIDPRNVAVVRHEPPLENWGFGCVAACAGERGNGSGELQRPGLRIPRYISSLAG